MSKLFQIRFYLVEQPKLLNLIIKSNIVKPKLAIIIANWIDGNDSNVFSFSKKYKFNLRFN